MKEGQKELQLSFSEGISKDETTNVRKKKIK